MLSLLHDELRLDVDHDAADGSGRFDGQVQVFDAVVD